jgi:membrane-associated phospholipid phosphatase
MLKTRERSRVTSAAPPYKHRFSDLRTPGLLARSPAIGLMLFVLGALAFGVITVNVQNPNSALVRSDVQITNQLHALALTSTPLILMAMIAGFYMGEQMLVVIGVLSALYFLFKRYWREFWMVIIAWAGEGAMWWGLSGYFNRSRPHFAVEAWHLMTAPSYPSGHVFASVLVFGLLAYVIAPRMATGFGKILVIATAVAIPLYIGFARVYIGDHYPSDVYGGIALGVAWGALVYTVIERLSYRRRPSAVTP